MRQPLGRWLWSSIGDSPDRNRREGAIREVQINLEKSSGEARKADWWISSDQHLAQASKHLDAGNYHQGWVSLQSTVRMMLLDPKDPDALEREAIKLRHDLTRVSSRRAKQITDLICDADGELRPEVFAGSLRIRVIDALALRDEQYNTDYFKIMLRRRHLRLLFLLLLLGIAACLVLSFVGVFPSPFDRFGLMAGVVLFGVLGAALSVARGLLATDLSAKIPAQQLGSFVIWMRPAIGAAAALIAFVLLNAKVLRLLDWDPTSPNIIFTVAVVAGYSERFIVGSIERIAEGNDKKDVDKKEKDKRGRAR